MPKFTKQVAIDLWDHTDMHPVDILRVAVRSGVEYPDATWLVTEALNLDDDAVYQMEQDYMELT